MRRVTKETKEKQMATNKEEVWADLMYALDNLYEPPRDMHSLDAYEDEFIKRFPQIKQPLSMIYSMAKERAETTIAHEAIEKGLKAILIDNDLSIEQVKRHRHHLDKLLLAVQQHSPTAFDELERCFESTMDYLEITTSRTSVARYRTNIIDYFQKHGKEEVFVANRYASIEGFSNAYGMIGFIYLEIIRALMSLVFGWTPEDIISRVEEEAREAVLTESKRDRDWDAAGWLSQGPAHPRLEDISNLANNEVLCAAVRRCARESKDRGTRYWAQGLRHKHVLARRKARTEHRVGLVRI